MIHDHSPDAPNISLNLRGAHRRAGVRTLAALGVVLQFGLLVFFAHMVYHPTFKLGFTKDDKPVPKYAFPVTCAGTLTLVIGMFLCVHAVERGTQEKTYRASDEFEMRLYWLQHQQTVNDQMFEPFSITSGNTCSAFSISRREEKYRQKKGLENLQQVKATAGVMVGLAGFILQFIGFRDMHPYAALSQLCAVGLMTACRAVAFPGFTTSLKAAKLVPNFELDWLAQKLGIVTGLISQQAPKDGKDGEDADLEHCSLASWRIFHDRQAGYRALEPLDDGMSQTLPSEAQCLLVTRRGLGRLTKMHTVSSEYAARLATAMEEGLGILFPEGPNSQGARGFRWVLDVSMERVTQQVWIDLSFTDGAWKVAADDLDAALSLWAYTAEAEKERRERQGTGRVEPGMEGLGPDGINRIEGYVIHDLEVWCPAHHRVLAANKETSEEGLRRRLKRLGAPGRDNPGLKTSESNDSLARACLRIRSSLLFPLVYGQVSPRPHQEQGSAEVQPFM